MSAYQMLWYQLNFAERKKLIWQNHKTTSKYPNLFQYWNLFNGRAHIIEPLEELCLDLITRPAPTVYTFNEALLDKYPQAKQLRERGYREMLHSYNWSFKNREDHNKFTTLYAISEWPSTFAEMLSGNFMLKLLDEIEQFNKDNPEFALNLDFKEFLTSPLFLWYGYQRQLSFSRFDEGANAKEWLKYANTCAQSEGNAQSSLRAAIEYGSILIKKDKEMRLAQEALEAARLKQQKETLAQLQEKASPALKQLREIFLACPSTVQNEFRNALKSRISNFA